MASTSFSCVFIAEFEQINAGWEKNSLKKFGRNFFIGWWLQDEYFFASPDINMGAVIISFIKQN